MVQKYGKGVTLDEYIRSNDQLNAQHEALVKQIIELKRQQDEIERQRQVLGNNYGGVMPNYGNNGENFNPYVNQQQVKRKTQSFCI